jgi:ribosomal protein S18 acetylase RimI-like enzyme
MGPIETVEAANRDEVLARVLAPPGGAVRAPRTQVRSFARYLSACALEWTALRHRRGQRETALLFILFLPGRTAIAMFPETEATGIVPEDQQQLLAAGLKRLAQRGLYYVQALVEPTASGKRELLRASEFRHLTQLIYLQRSASFPWFDPPDAREATWIAYDEGRHEMFARMLLATYEDSRDCPELTSLRPIDAVIASHKAAGEFNPALWEMACIDGEHAGCILLAPLVHGSLMEIVYMGVASSQRRRGVGKLLLRRALDQCRRRGARELTVVVDRRNWPARQLYAGFGFKPTAAREAYIYAW